MAQGLFESLFNSWYQVAAPFLHPFPSHYKVFQHQHLNTFWSVDAKPREWQTKACQTEDAAKTSTAYFIVWLSLVYNTVPKPSCVITSLCIRVLRETFSRSLRPRSFYKQMQPAASNCARGGKDFAVCIVLPPDLRSVFLSTCLCKLSKEHWAGNKIRHF